MKKLLLMGALLGGAVLGWATLVNVTLVSGDPNTCVMVYGPIDHYAGPGDAAWEAAGAGKCAVVTWWHPNWPALGTASWISDAYYLQGDPKYDSWRKFEALIKVPCAAYDIGKVTLDINADNAERIWFNGQWIGEEGEVEGTTDYGFDWQTVLTYSNLDLKPGLNKFVFIVRNYGEAGTATSNPTGLIFSVTGLGAYKLPDVVWQPPVINDSFVLKMGTTLPVKFKLYRQDGSVIMDMQNVYMSIHKGTCGSLVGPPVITWPLGEGVSSLRFDGTEFYYIGNFRTTDFELTPGEKYSAVVYDGCTQQKLGCIDFVLENKGDRSDR